MTLKRTTVCGAVELLMNYSLFRQMHQFYPGLPNKRTVHTDLKNKNTDSLKEEGC